MGVAAVLIGAILALTQEQELYRAGRQAEADALYPRAFGAYSDCTELDGPLAPYARIRMAACKAQSGDPSTATNDLENFLGRQSDGPWTRLAAFELGTLYASIGNNAAAAKALARAVDTTLEPWWLEDIQWAAAENLLNVDDRRPEAFDFFRQMANNSPWSKKRFDAATILSDSPFESDLIDAAFAFIRAGASREAQEILDQVNAIDSTDALLSERAQLATARILLAKRKQDSARNILRDLINDATHPPVMQEALYQLIRDHINRDEFDSANTLLERFKEVAPESYERFSAISSLARKHQRNEDYDEALAAYRIILSEHPLASGRERALLEVATIYRESDRPDRAINTYTALASGFPRSDRVAEAAFWAGTLHEQADETEQAMAQYRTAVAHGLTRYYGYRSQQRLAELDDQEAKKQHPIPASKSTILVRTIEPRDVNKNMAQPDTADDQQITRLRFFATQGYSEAKWEALYLGDQLATDAEPGPVYRAMGEAGSAYATMQFASAANYGVSASGQQSITRLRIRYPKVFWEQVQDLGEETGVDPYLILSIARQETTYRPSLVSHAGAIGLMQVMPKTAKWIEGEIPEIGAHTLKNLKHPESSLRLGTFYLKYLLGRYNGNLVYALASYNGGPSNCDAWRRNFKGDTLAEFIEEIPFTETRNYVKRVLAHYTTYLSIYPES